MWYLRVTIHITIQSPIFQARTRKSFSRGDWLMKAMLGPAWELRQERRLFEFTKTWSHRFLGHVNINVSNLLEIWLMVSTHLFCLWQTDLEQVRCLGRDRQEAGATASGFLISSPKFLKTSSKDLKTDHQTIYKNAFSIFFIGRVYLKSVVLLDCIRRLLTWYHDSVADVQYEMPCTSRSKISTLCFQRTLGCFGTRYSDRVKCSLYLKLGHT